MTSTEPKDDRPDITTMVIRLAVQALIEKLVASGALDSDDLADMRGYGLQHAADLAAHRSPTAPSGTAALEHRIVSWWEGLNAPALPANDP